VIAKDPQNNSLFAISKYIHIFNLFLSQSTFL
jgi:hypothetical protein